MKRTSVQASLAGLFAALVASQTLADTRGVPSLPSAGSFSITPEAGTSFNVGGEMVKSGSQSINNTAIFGNAVTGVTTFSVNSRSFSDTFETPIQVGLSGNYGLTNADELSATLHYLHASGKSFDALTASAAGTINGVPFGVSATFQGKFSDYNEVGLDAGIKHFINMSSAFHPYVGARAGASHTDSLSLDMSFAGTPVINALKFYQAGWTWMAGLQAGFRIDVAPSMALGLETGLNYTGDLRTDSSEINPGSAGGLSGVNSGGNRWDIPVMAGATIKF